MIVKCHKQFLFERCRERGYQVEQVLPCVVSRDGDVWEIDTSHWAYPHERKKASGGAGTELKKLLRFIGITAKPNCSCNTKARVMDERGIEWCEKNAGVIVTWLEQEAKRRRLPFVRTAGMAIVRRAIKTAKKRAAKEG